jgi:hypothetical protein
MSTTAVDTEQVRAEAEAALQEARIRRERLSLDALAGVEQAAEELVVVEAEIAQFERTIAIASLATAEKTRRDRVAEEESARAARAQAAREAQVAAVERQQKLRAVRVELVSLAAAVSEFLTAEHALQDCSVRAAQPFRPLAPSVSLLTVIALTDAGLPNDVFGWVPASTRKRLLDAFPAAALELEQPVSEVRTGRPCTVCEHPEADAINEAIAQGTVLRTIAARFDVTPSALSRHRNAHTKQ